MRVLFLASYFPRPLNPAMGIWALREAQQLALEGVDVRVVAVTSWVPRWLGRRGRAATWAQCPNEYEWDGIHVDYPRWPFYQFGLLKKIWYRWPALTINVGWPFVAPFLRRFVREWQPNVCYAH